MNPQRILVFGDSNSWGFVPCTATELTTRYDASTRWPTVMAARLGSGVELVEEALSGRTTDLDDFEIDLPSKHLKGAIFNGAKLLPAILASHLPLDLVIIMLGTNDLKARFKRTPQSIAKAAARTCPVDRRVRGRCGNRLSDTESSPARSAATRNEFSSPRRLGRRSRKKPGIGFGDQGSGECGQPSLPRCGGSYRDRRDRRSSSDFGSATQAWRSRREEGFRHSPGPID